MDAAIQNLSKLAFEPPQVLILGQPRSGTHFLEESLASHPQVYTRGECFLRYQRSIAHNAADAPIEKRLLTNKLNRVNIGILMYYIVDSFVANFGPLSKYQIIHVLRNPKNVALSIAQMEADRRLLGPNFRAHRKLNVPASVHAPILMERVAAIEIEVMRLQNKFCTALHSFSNVLTIEYEILTADCQTNQLPEEYGRLLLDFLHLPYCRLKNSLQKTGTTFPS